MMGCVSNLLRLLGVILLGLGGIGVATLLFKESEGREWAWVITILLALALCALGLFLLVRAPELLAQIWYGASLKIRPEMRRQRLAVLPFSLSEDDHSKLGLAMSELLASDLNSRSGLCIVSFTLVAKNFNMWLAHDECFSDCIKRLQVDLVVGGECRVRNGIFQCKSWLLDYKSNSKEELQNISDKDVMQVCSKLTELLLQRVDTESVAHQSKRPGISIEQFNAFANGMSEWITLIKGIECYTLSELLIETAKKETGDKTSQAMASFTKALTIGPEFAEAHNCLGRVLSLQGQHDKAAVEYQYALSLNKDYVEAYTNLAVTLIQSKKYKEAEKVLQTALRINPGYTEAYLASATIKLLQNSHREALRLASDAISVNPSSSCYLSRAELFRIAGDYKLALKDCDRALNCDPDNISIYKARALANLCRAAPYDGKIFIDAVTEDMHNKANADITKALQLMLRYGSDYSAAIDFCISMGRIDLGWTLLAVAKAADTMLKTETISTLVKVSIPTTSEKKLQKWTDSYEISKHPVEELLNSISNINDKTIALAVEEGRNKTQIELFDNLFKEYAARRQSSPRTDLSLDLTTVNKLLDKFLPHGPNVSLYRSPDIPSAKLEAAINEYASELKAEQVLALYDATVFGKADRGFLITIDGIYYNESEKERGEMRWTDVRKVVYVGKWPTWQIYILMSGDNKRIIKCTSVPVARGLERFLDKVISFGNVKSDK